jgi:DNA-binding transcriptional LysR family regulator
MDRLAVMETFIRVVDTGSFSAAARQLTVGQPAVSKSIAQLEDRLGVRLLMRSTRRLMPTEAGHAFYEQARRIVDAADQADLAARGAAAGLTGRLRVSAAPTLSRLHLVPRLPLFLAAHPKLSVDLVLTDLPVNLIQEGVDVGFRTGEQRASSLTVRKVASCRRMVLGSPAYFEQAGVPSTPAGLNRHSAVIFSDQREGAGGEHWTFSQGKREISVKLSGRLRVSAAEGVRAAVIAGMGYAIASQWMFAPELASGAVRPVLNDWTLPTIDLWALFPAGRKVSAKARAFAAFVEASLKDIHSQQE